MSSDKGVRGSIKAERPEAWLDRFVDDLHVGDKT